MVEKVQDNKTLFIAHAGIHLKSTIAGQNSLESIELAARAGFDFCEIDTRQTKDGIPVVIHNETLNATYKNANDYSDLIQDVYVKDKTLSELKSLYVFKTDNSKYRTTIPTLEQAAETARKNRITLMVHPKISTPEYLEKVLDICNRTIGKNKFYIVSEDPAVRYVLSNNPNQCTMMIVKDKAMADQFAKYPNCILAVSWKLENYDELASYCRSLGSYVETTLHNDVRTLHYANVVNYDWMSPAKFDIYSQVKTIKDTVSYISDKEINYGTACLSFSLKGKANINCCGHVFDLETRNWETYRIPVLLYKEVPSFSIDDNCASLKDIVFQEAEH